VSASDFLRDSRISRVRGRSITKTSPLYLFCPIGAGTKASAPFAHFKPSFGNTGGTPMILFARPQRHARRQAQGIIGVPPVFPILAHGANRKMKTTALRSSIDTDTGHRHFLIVQASQALCNLPWSLWIFPLLPKILSSRFQYMD
jgi:hypothetical protein